MIWRLDHTIWVSATSPWLGDYHVLQLQPRSCCEPLQFECIGFWSLPFIYFVGNVQKWPIASYLKWLNHSFKFCCKAQALKSIKEGRLDQQFVLFPLPSHIICSLVWVTVGWASWERLSGLDPSFGITDPRHLTVSNDSDLLSLSLSGRHLSHMTKPTKWLCAQGRLRPARASPVWLESSLCAQWVAKDPSFLHAGSEDSDQTGWISLIRLGGCPGWSDSSLGAHSLCWCCHVAAHLHCLASLSSFQYPSIFSTMWWLYSIMVVSQGVDIFFLFCSYKKKKKYRRGKVWTALNFRKQSYNLKFAPFTVVIFSVIFLSFSTSHVL